MDHSDHPSKAHLLSLPTELLHHVFHLARNPLLSHVCRDLWQRLPAFVPYTMMIGRRAFGADINPDTIIANIISRNPAPLNLGSGHDTYTEFDENRLNMQADACLEWLTVKQFSKLKKLCFLACVRSVFENMDCRWTEELSDCLKEVIDSSDESRIFPCQALNPRPNRLLPELLTIGYGIEHERGTLKLVIAPDILLLIPQDQPTLGRVLVPFLPANGLLPTLFPQIAKFDVRALELSEQIALLRIVEWESGSPYARADTENLYGQNGSMILIKSIHQILDHVEQADGCRQGVVSKETVNKCISTLFKFDNVMSPREWRRGRRRRSLGWHYTLPIQEFCAAHVSDRPIRIKHDHYFYVIQNRNLRGLELLLHHNWAIYKPSVDELKDIILYHLRTHLATTFEQLGNGVKIPQDLDNESTFRYANALGEPRWEQMLNMITETRQRVERVDALRSDIFGAIHESQSLFVRRPQNPFRSLVQRGQAALPPLEYVKTRNKSNNNKPVTS